MKKKVNYLLQDYNKFTNLHAISICNFKKDLEK